MIVAVEGIDGAGKSHLCQLLLERLRGAGHRVAFLEKHSLDLGNDFAGRRMAELRSIIWPAEPEPPHDALGTDFYLFLLAAWFAGLPAMLTRPLADNEFLLSDGSFYRVMAKAHNRAGFDVEWLESLFERALRPDLVILLDIDPADAWRRRTEFKTTELGRWDGHATCAESAFRSYQGAIRKTLLTLAQRHGWHVIRQTAETAPEESAAAAEQAVIARVRRARPC